MDGNDDTAEVLRRVLARLDALTERVEALERAAARTRTTQQLALAREAQLRSGRNLDAAMATLDAMRASQDEFQAFIDGGLHARGETRDEIEAHRAWLQAQLDALPRKKRERTEP